MKLCTAYVALLLVTLSNCCPFSLFSNQGPGAELDVDQLCAAILEKEAPGLSLKGELQVMGNWAFFLGDTVNSAGERVTPSQGLSSDSVVLFRKLDDKWLVVEHGIGITDAYYFAWYETHDLPKGLLEP